MAEIHKDEFYVIEVAPGLFLEDYEQESAYCAGPQLYYRRCDIYPGDEAFKHDKIYRLSVARFSSRIDALSYIRKRGSEKDFKAWCSVLADELGGAGVPRIRKVKMTITAEINREEDEFLFSGRKSRF